MYSFLFVLTSVVTLVLSSWIYLYLNQCPTEKIIGDMEDIADSIDIIKESLENIAQL